MDLKEFCLTFMMSSEDLESLNKKNFGNSLPLGKKVILVKSIIDKGITLEQIRKFCKMEREKANSVLIRKILSSDKLTNHNWEKARPSNLHLSMQNLVRSCLANNIDIEEYLKKGSNIVKHEFFITAVHDLIEQKIIDEFERVIPSIASRSTIDFIFEEIPYDLKVTPPLKEWTFDEAKKFPEKFARSLYEGQDSDRIRSSAKVDWEFNRLFLVYKEDSLWQQPEKMERKVIEMLKKKISPFNIEIDGKEIKCLVVFIE